MSVYVKLGGDEWREVGYLTSEGFELDFSSVDEPAHSSRGFSIDRMRGFVLDGQDYAVSASLRLTLHPEWGALLGEIPGTWAWRYRVAQRREVLRSYLAALERHEAREAERLREAVKYEAAPDDRAERLRLADEVGPRPFIRELVAQHEAYLRETLAAVGVPVYSIESDGHTVHITYEPPQPPLPDIRPAIEALWRDFNLAASLPLPGINGAAGVDFYREMRAARSASAATAQRLRSILDSRES